MSSGREVARKLHLSASAVSKLAVRGRKDGLAKEIGEWKGSALDRLTPSILQLIRSLFPCHHGLHIFFNRSGPLDIKLVNQNLQDILRHKGGQCGPEPDPFYSKVKQGQKYDKGSWLMSSRPKTSFNLRAITARE